MTAGSEMQRFSADLGKIAARAVPDVDKVLEVGANKIKKGLNENLKASSSFRVASGSVTYDRKGGLGNLSYMIGPDKNRRAGALGNIAFFGTSRGGGTVDLEGPLREEAPVIEGLLDDLLGKWSRSV